MILIAVLIFSIGPIVLLWLVACGWKNRAVKAESALDVLRQSYEDMRRIAGEAIQAATEKHFPAKARERFGKIDGFPIPSRSASSYVPPEVKFCVCNVSVRSEKWPVACPACGKLVGDDSILDAEVIE